MEMTKEIQEIPTISIARLREFFEGIKIRAKNKFMISFYRNPNFLEKEIVKAVQKWAIKKEVSDIERSAVPAHGNTYDIGDGYTHIACLGYWSGTNEPLYYADKHCLELFVKEEKYFLVDQHEEGRGRDVTITTTLLCEVVIPEGYTPVEVIPAQQEIKTNAYSGHRLDVNEVDNSEEERREVNGIRQHKHKSHDFWHPTGRAHSKEQNI